MLELKPDLVLTVVIIVATLLKAADFVSIIAKAEIKNLIMHGFRLL